jgi:hypothetical protein
MEHQRAVPGRHVVLQLAPGQDHSGGPIGLERPGDAIGPDAGFLAHVCEIATQEGRIGSHPEHALRIVACRAAGSTCSTADTSCWSGI